MTYLCLFTRLLQEVYCINVANMKSLTGGLGLSRTLNRLGSIINVVWLPLVHSEVRTHET